MRTVRPWGSIPTNPPELYRPNGCSKCNFTGFRGRTGVFELVIVDEELRTLIHDGASEQQLERQARTRTLSIDDDGRRLVLEGLTSLEELLRVTRES